MFNHLQTLHYDRIDTEIRRPCGVAPFPSCPEKTEPHATCHHFRKPGAYTPAHPHKTKRGGTLLPRSHRQYLDRYLRRAIKGDPELEEKLRKAGYRPRLRYLTERQMRILTYYIG